MSEHLDAPDTTRFPTLAPGHIMVLPTGTRLGRIHSLGGSHPAAWNEFRRFGPTGARFDHHPDPSGVHPDHGILYAAPSVPDRRGVAQDVLRTCVAEVFRDNGVVDLSTGTPYFTVLALAEDLRLLDVADSDWVTRAGGNAAISSGPRAPSRQWARAVHAHYTGEQAVHGIHYTCSNRPPDRSVALFERASVALQARPVFSEPLTHVGLRSRMVRAASDLGLVLQP